MGPSLRACPRPPLSSPRALTPRCHGRVAGPGAGRRQRRLAVDRQARRRVGRGTDRAGQPAPRHADRLHDAPRHGRRHLGHADVLPVARRLDEPAPRRGGQRRRARPAQLLRQPRVVLPGRPRDPHGRSRRAARPARAAPPAARRGGPVRPRAQARPAVPPRPGRPGDRAQQRRRARRPRERAPPLASRAVRGGLRRHAGHPLGEPR